MHTLPHTRTLHAHACVRLQVLSESGRPWRVSWQVDPSNEGVVLVHIPGGDEPSDEAAGGT